MNVRLEEVASDNLQILRNLAILYRYDLMPAFYRDCAACDLNQFGTFDEDKRSHDESARSWDWVVGNPGKTCAFLIWSDDKLAGFAAICMPPHCHPAVQFRINDFFVLNKFRRTGVGQQAAFMCFDRFQGIWELEYGKQNLAAAAFWPRVVSTYTSSWSDWRQEGRLEAHMDALKFDTTARLASCTDSSNQ